jgi:hypothetical protein
VTRLVAYRLVDARRAMACWNALEGLTIEQIEAIKLSQQSTEV